MFININVHSNYSLLQSTITIDDIIKFAIDNNQKYVSLIDINTMYGTIEFYNKAKKNNLVPIIGLQINYENEKIILIAKNYEGYLNIVKISSFIMIKKKYELKLFLNSIIVIFDTTIPKWFNENRNDFYTVNGKNKVAIRDCFYKEKNDISILKAIFAIKNDELFENININSFENKYMLKENEALTFFSKEALNNLEKLISSIDLEKITDGENNFVKYNNAINSNELIYESCINGLKKKMENIPTTYIERLKYELEIINNKNFNDYFLVVQDYVEFAKREGIFVGPGRGSACGSLVSYSLGITEIDPIENNLYFERFLNPERVGFPDIDIDFMDTRKNEIIEYLIKKYSMNKVAHIITFQRMKSKMAIRDVGRILNIKLEIINLISKLFSSEYDENINLAIEKNKNIKEYSKKFPELFTIASKLINFPRQIGLHAAGMVIVNTELYNIVPIQLNNSGDIFTTQYSMEYLEELGVIKIDLLSLSNLTIINNILQKINKNGTKIDLLKINFNDENVFKNLSNGKTLGIFQLESPGMTNLIKKIKPKNIEDISITSALFRPGPQKLIVEFLKNREEPKSIEYFDEMFEKILKPTSGIIIYQEQLIDIIKKITSFSVGEADIFRRIISKKDSSKLSLVEENFKEKAKKNGYKAEYIEKIFNYIKQFASYGFNHAHSIAYAYISYWMAYLKCKYPMEFFTEILSSNDGNNEKISEYINEAKEYDISFLQPSINNSNFNFEIFDNKILFGFSVVKGIGYETIKKLLSTRRSFGKKFTNWLETIAFLSKNGISVKTIELLIKIGAFDEILNDKTRSFLLKNINEIYSKSKTTLKTGEMLIKPNLIQINETEEMKKSLHEEQNLLLGFSFLEHPIIKVKNDKKINNFHKIIELRNLKENNKLKLFVLINNVREIKTKNGFLMASIKFEDETGSNNAIVFPNIYKKISDFLLQNKYFIATICKKNNELQLIDLEIN